MNGTIIAENYFFFLKPQAFLEKKPLYLYFFVCIVRILRGH